MCAPATLSSALEPPYGPELALCASTMIGTGLSAKPIASSRHRTDLSRHTPMRLFHLSPELPPNDLASLLVGRNQPRSMCKFSPML